MSADKRKETAQKATYERRESARQRQETANHQCLLDQRAAQRLLDIRVRATRERYLAVHCQGLQC